MDPEKYWFWWKTVIVITLIWVAARALGMERHGRFVAPGVAFFGIILLLAGVSGGIFLFFVGVLTTLVLYIVKDLNPPSKVKEEREVIE